MGENGSQTAGTSSAESGAETKSGFFSVAFASLSNSSEAVGSSGDAPQASWLQYFNRNYLKTIINSLYYQVALLCLVVVEAVVVIVELMVEAEGGDELAGLNLHILALFLLAIFNLEIAVKIFVFQKEIFDNWSEVADCVIVIVATVLEATSLYHKGAGRAGGLVLLLRLWRLVRIQNSMMTASRLTGEKQLKKEKERVKQLEEEMREKEKKIETLQARNSVLELTNMQQNVAKTKN